MNLILVGFLLAILAALFSGLYFLVKDKSGQDQRRVLNALTWRVALQLGLIVFLIVAFLMAGSGRTGSAARKAMARYRT